MSKLKIKEIEKLKKKTMSFREKNEYSEEELKEYYEDILTLAENEDAESIYYVADLLNKNDKYEAAESYYLEAIKKGYNKAYYDLGMLYYDKLIEKKGFKDAYINFNKSVLTNAENKNLSIIQLADMHTHKEYVDRDFDYAYKILKNILPSENDEAALFKKGNLADILYRLSRLNLIKGKKENSIEAIKYGLLAYQVFMDYYEYNEDLKDGPTSFFEEMLLDNVDDLMMVKDELKTYKPHKLFYVVKGAKVSELKTLLDDLKEVFIITGIFKHKEENSIMIRIKFLNHYAALTNYKYAGRIDVIDIVVRNVTSSYYGDYDFFNDNGETLVTANIKDKELLIEPTTQEKIIIKFNDDSEFYIGKINYRDNSRKLVKIENELYDPKDYLYSNNSKKLYCLEIVISGNGYALFPGNSRCFYDFDSDYFYEELGLSKKTIEMMEKPILDDGDYLDDLISRILAEVGDNFKIINNIENAKDSNDYIKA